MFTFNYRNSINAYVINVNPAHFEVEKSGFVLLCHIGTQLISKVTFLCVKISRFMLTVWTVKEFRYIRQRFI